MPLGYFDNIYADDHLPHRARAVYIYLHDRADKQGKCWPALGTIGSDLGLSVSTVKRAVADLKTAGYIQTEQRWRANGGKSSLLFHIDR